MFGAQYFGQEDFGGVVVAIAVRPPSGGGWTHRGAVVLPKRRPTSLPSLPSINPTLPSLPKPPYIF